MINEEQKNNIVRLGNYYGKQFGTGYAGNVWDTRYLCPALMTMAGGGRQPHILEIRYEK